MSCRKVEDHGALKNPLIVIQPGQEWTKKMTYIAFLRLQKDNEYLPEQKVKCAWYHW